MPAMKLPRVLRKSSKDAQKAAGDTKKEVGKAVKKTTKK
jgi:hypothetical protein